MSPDADRETGRHILVVERDMIVGLSLAEDLLDLGFRVSGPFISAEDALALMPVDPPDLAIVDVSLRDGSGTLTARALAERAIPFVLFSARDSRETREGEFAATPWVDKPASTERLLEVLNASIAGRVAPMAGAPA